MRKKFITYTLLMLFALLLLVLGTGFFFFRYVYPVKYVDMIKIYANENNLDPVLVASVIHTESRYKEEATSSKDARGLMQLTETTANWGAEELSIKDFSFDTVYDPEINIQLGTWYLNKLFSEFSEEDTVLAAYNAGSGRVTSWLLDSKYSIDGKTLHHIPYGETENFVNRVHTAKKIYRFIYTFY